MSEIRPHRSGRVRALLSRLTSWRRSGSGSASTQRAQLLVNGQHHHISIQPAERLLDVLRDQLGLTGAKRACGRGECGACTVLIAGRPHLACITLAARVDGEVTTVEGLAESTQVLRTAFGRLGGLQCGFCTPGQIVQGAHLLAAGLPETDAALRHALAGNVCRCTGYVGIINALRAAQTPDAEASVTASEGDA